MSEHFEKYVETDWANKLLIKVQDQFLDNKSRATFRRALNINQIQEHEFDDFLNAYKNGNEALKQFLENRAIAINGEKKPEIEPSKPLEKKEEKEHRIAA